MNKTRPKEGPLDYINNAYRLKLKVGQKVTVLGKEGTITGSSGPHVAIKIDGDNHSKPYHPSDVITG